MERKRKMPARTTRGEPAAKKRNTSPPEQAQQVHITAQPTPPVDEPLPKSIVAGKPLPTLTEPQPENLSANEFHTISESGVLGDSLQRSRAKWLSEGIFERYWTKVTAKRKKEAPQLLNNPPKESMTKLGTCTITVEPHIFEATMYAIKDTTSRILSPTPQQAMYRPIIQYGPPGGAMPLPGSQTPIQHKLEPILQPAQRSTPGLQDATAVHQQQPVPLNGTSVSATPAVDGLNEVGTAQNKKSELPTPHKPPNPLSATTKTTTTRSTDPVIQMLAERAASDPTLKALMRIVANGQATPEELKRFQKHIDELTILLKARQQNEQTSQESKTGTPNPTSSNGQAHNTQQNGSSATSPAPVVKASPATVQYQAQPQPQPQALRSKGPLPPMKPDISGIVFEFTGGSGDRFLFPKFSILEYLPQGQVIASFLIVRKGSQSDSPSYDPALDYYQPITIRLYAHQGRQLEALQKVVAHPEEVRRYMDDIMDNMTRAEYVLLAMRLPKETEPETEKAPEPEPVEQIGGPVLWMTPSHPTPPPAPQFKPAKKLLTEGEQYQNFITTVSEKPVY
ncbi:hypothetical protein BJ878DRAFT_518318 [Calycina marina]|uniref:SWR1-complex protein 3 domain-containing protein n=1 Tax=Calycina marina TaxID=1763456 RepID=A0A9P8CCQ6_9HELO|nr:hypothetical protein BJ878DRAFT_518318 [Calycina marina]